MKTKKYLNVDELIKTIIQKGIVIENEDNVRKILKQHNYYVIMGYKHLFLDNNGNYNNVSFENIYNLYLFDRKLKLLLLDSLLDIENIIKTSVVNRFCSVYGFKEDQYLDKANYNINHKYVDRTIGIFKNQISEKEKNHTAILYYKQNYGFVPFWVVSKVLSFGLLRELYSIMKDDDKQYVKNEVSNFKDVKIKNLFTFMQLFVDMRNRAGHDEILFNERHRRILLPKLLEHKKFNLSNNDGLNDLLGLLIAMKNILPKDKFNILIKNIDKLIKRFIKENNNVELEDLLKEMNLPINYKKLKWKKSELSA